MSERTINALQNIIDVGESEGLDHDPAVCGECCYRQLMTDTAREVLAMDPAPRSLMLEWIERLKERWEGTKFHKLWLAEKEAGRNPEEAFTARGWEP